MTLNLDEKYGISSDNIQFSLFEKVMSVNKATKEIYANEKIIGSYGGLEAALKGYLKYSIRSSDVEDIKEVMELIHEVEKNIKTAVGDIYARSYSLTLKK